MTKFPAIQTDRLLIRLLECSDAEWVFAYRSLEVVSRYQSWKPKDLREVEEFILVNTALPLNSGNSWTQLAVCLIDGPLIGDLGIHFLEDPDQVEIDYTLSPEFQGEGYAMEAVSGVVDYLFIALKKHRAIASVDPANERSIHLLEKLGFRKEGHFLKSCRVADQWADDYLYAILEEDWKRFY